MHRSSPEPRRDHLDQVALAEVLVGVAHVEDPSCDLAALSAENRRNRSSGVSHVDVRPPKELAVDLQCVLRPEVAGELVDREVEPHPVGDPVDGGKAQAGPSQPLVISGEQRRLDRDLLFRVQRHGTEFSGLVDRNGRIGHPPVVAARRGEDEAFDPNSRRVIDECAASLDIDGVRQLGLTGTRRIADDGRQMDDSLCVFQRLPSCCGVTDVRDDQRDTA